MRGDPRCPCPLRFAPTGTNSRQARSLRCGCVRRRSAGPMNPANQHRHLEMPRVRRGGSRCAPASTAGDAPAAASACMTRSPAPATAVRPQAKRMPCATLRYAQGLPAGAGCHRGLLRYAAMRPATRFWCAMHAADRQTTQTELFSATTQFAARAVAMLQLGTGCLRARAKATPGAAPRPAPARTAPSA